MTNEKMDAWMASRTKCQSIHPKHGIQCIAFVDENGDQSPGQPHVRHGADRRVRNVNKSVFWTDEDVAQHEEELAYRLEAVANDARRATLRRELAEEQPADPSVLVYEYKPEALVAKADEVTLEMVHQFMRVYPDGLSDQKMASLRPLRSLEDAGHGMNNVATPSQITAKRLRLEKQGVVHCKGFTRMKNSKSDTRVWALSPGYVALLDDLVGLDLSATDNRERWDFFGGPLRST
jgi:hypothetical protein